MLKYYISILKGDSPGHAQNKGRYQKHWDGGGVHVFLVFSSDPSWTIVSKFRKKSNAIYHHNSHNYHHHCQNLQHPTIKTIAITNTTTSINFTITTTTITTTTGENYNIITQGYSLGLDTSLKRLGLPSEISPPYGCTPLHRSCPPWGNFSPVLIELPTKAGQFSPFSRT